MLEYADARKVAKAICHRKKKTYEENGFHELQDRYSRNKTKNFTKGCEILREAFHQESQYVRLRLGI
jgi:hypothetical protein